MEHEIDINAYSGVITKHDREYEDWD